MSRVDLISMLHKAKRTGDGTWIACCPAHNDESPSMTVRECDDGRWLIHCFAGCEPLEILGALGLKFDDLFPDRINPAKPIRRPFPAADVLECLSFEATVVLCYASAIVDDGFRPEPSDTARIALALSRIGEGVRIANG